MRRGRGRGRDRGQVSQVRVVENPKSALGRWFVIKAKDTPSFAPEAFDR